MRKLEFLLPAFATLLLAAGPALADKYTDTISLFKNAGQSASFFNKSYGYAVFPTIGKAGLGIGGAHGEGRVYEQGKYVGDTKMTQLSIGFQAGAEGFSEIIFFQDKRSFDEFTSGNFEFGANVSAVVITAAASGTATRPDRRRRPAAARRMPRPPASTKKARRSSSSRRAA